MTRERGDGARADDERREEGPATGDGSRRRPYFCKGAVRPCAPFARAYIPKSDLSQSTTWAKKPFSSLEASSTSVPKASS